MKYTLLIDVTLTAINTTLTGENSELSQQNFTLSQPAETITAEQIVTEMLTAIKKVQATLTNDDFIETITFAEMTLDSLVPFDEQKKALMPIIYAHDTQKYIDALMMNGVIGQLERKTGLVFQEVTPLMQILWLKNEEPEIFAKAAQYMNIQSYIIYRLFDLEITSPAAAGRTGFYNLVNQSWDDQALALNGLTSEQLPRVVDVNVKSFKLTSEMRTYLGITEDTTFHMN